MIARGEEGSVKRDLFGAAGGEPSGMEVHDPHNIVMQVCCPSYSAIVGHHKQV
jgi:hypothetical protein